MDARGRLEPHEREAIGQSLWWLGLRAGTALTRDDLVQEAHIALWRTQHTRRAGSEADAMRVCRNAMVDAVRAELGRLPGSRNRMPGERVEYLVGDDERVGGDCPESSLRVQQALRLLASAGAQIVAAVEAMCAHDSQAAAAASLGMRHGADSLAFRVRHIRERLALSIEGV